MNLQEQILKAINNSKDMVYISYILPDIYDVSEMSAEDLMIITIPFVNAKYYESENYKIEALSEYSTFIEYVDKLGIMSKKFIYPLSRDDKILTYQIKKNIRLDIIDWGDKEWLLNLIKYLYVISQETVYYINLENELLNYKEDIKESTQINDMYRVDIDKFVNYDREALLTNRFKPKYTLDEFGDKLLRNIEKYKQRGVQETGENREEDLEVEKDIQELRKEDEVKDDMVKGNTENMG